MNRLGECVDDAIYKNRRILADICRYYIIWELDRNALPLDWGKHRAVVHLRNMATRRQEYMDNIVNDNMEYIEYPRALSMKVEHLGEKADELWALDIHEYAKIVMMCQYTAAFCAYIDATGPAMEEYKGLDAELYDIFSDK